jgi:hypothetical protein
MSRGFVTFINNNQKYKDLLSVMIDSVLRLTNEDIEVFSLNRAYENTTGSSRVSVVQVKHEREDFAQICYTKLLAGAKCSFDEAVMLDADMVLTPHAIRLFDEIDLTSDVPYASLHPQDPNNQAPLMKHLGVKRKTQPYVHASFLFSRNSQDFLQECYDISQSMPPNTRLDHNYDETILNVMLWKYEKTHSLVDTYDPYFGHFFDLNNQFRKNSRGYVCHGCKDLELAKRILARIEDGDY